jgi:transcriptional regulator with XRE-family HTH domain
VNEVPEHEQLEAQLDAERERRNLNWREVAAALPMSPQNLSRIRNGEISVSRDARKKIDKFLAGEPERATPPPSPAGQRYEWSAATQARVRELPFDELLDFIRDIYYTSGERGACLLMITAGEARLGVVQTSSDTPQ